MTVLSIDAILLISDDAESLTTFYRDVVGLPITEERRDGISLHYGCDLGNEVVVDRVAEPWVGRIVHPPELAAV